MTFDSLNQDILSLNKTWVQRTNAFPDHGVLGDETGVIVDPLLPLTNVFVRMITSNGLSSRRSVILPADLNIQLSPGLPVLIGYNYKRLPIILGVDTEALAGGGVSSQTSVSQNNNGRITQFNIETLNIVAGGGLTVNLKGWNVIANGVYYEFSYSGISLSGFVPSSGEMCYACIFVKSDLSGVETFGSTAVLTSDLPLGADDINECLAQASSGSTPTWAVKLTGGLGSFDQTYLDNPANVKDLRQLVNNSANESYATLTTTNNTTTTIASIAVAELSALTIVGEYAAGKSDYTAMSTGTFRYGVRRATAGNVTQQAAATISQDGNAVLSLDVDTGTQTARIRVTGVSAETWAHRVTYRIVKVNS